MVLCYGRDDLEVTVTDDGSAAASGGRPSGSDRWSRRSGQGLVGMQQRATLLGGELAAGPGPGGGFQVTAKLPVDGGRP